MSLQADDKVAFEDIPVLGVGPMPPSRHDSSLHLCVPVLFLDVVVLPHV